ncbi:SH3 domain-containing protein [Acidovorax sp. Root568]|uniref:SH3 domain-containing protein n=1 Tax=Acidovorax sp. Root568 TaxID=1736565 RepID=UPI000AD8A737|nr:SH3 domain-containing protein [Acidovorax sp. Root568]
MKTLVHATRPRHWTMAALLGAVLVGPVNAQTPAVAPAKQRYVQGSWVNLRESAQSQARVVAQVPANTVLQQITERDGWCAVLYTGDARLGPPLPEPLQAHVACNLLADQPLTLAQAGKDAARAFWVAPSANRMRAYGNALPRPAALQLPALAQSHTPQMPVQYPLRPEWEAAKKLMRGGVLLRPEQEIDRGRPVNPLDNLKLATRAVDHIPAVAPLASAPTLPAVAPSYFRSHTRVALLHETEADGIAAVAGSRIAVEPTAVPYGSFNRHSGPEIEFVTGFWDVGGADLAFAPALTLYAITHQGLVGARTMGRRYWDISNADHYCGGHYPGKGFDDPRNDETTAVRGYAKVSDSAEVLVRLVVPGRLPPDAVKVRSRRYATSWMMPADPPIRDKPQRKNTAVMVHEIDLDRDGVADILRIDTPSPGGMSFEPIFEWRWYLNINGQWFPAGYWVDQECT